MPDDPVIADFKSRLSIFFIVTAIVVYNNTKKNHAINSGSSISRNTSEASRIEAASRAKQVCAIFS